MNYETGSVRVNITWGHFRVTIFGVEKQYYMHLVWVLVALAIQQAKRMCLCVYSVIILLWQQKTTHALAVQNVSTLYHIGAIVGKKCCST